MIPKEAAIGKANAPLTVVKVFYDSERGGGGLCPCAFDRS